MLKVAAFAGLLAGSLGIVGPAAAQTSTENSYLGGNSFVGRTRPTPACPSVVFHILREGDALSGVVFFADGSGVSSLVGSTNGASFSWHQTSISGKGPPGDVTGTISPQGAMVVRLTGTSCSFSATLPMLNEYSNG